MNKNTIDSLMHGKVPPQAVDLEEAVLGAVMLEREAAHTAIAQIKTADVFYKTQHQHIFQACINLYSKNGVIDIMTVTEECRRMGKLEECGGAYYITCLTDRVASSANIEFHIAILMQKWLRRQSIALCNSMITGSYEDEDDVFESLDAHILGMMSLFNTVNITGYEPVGVIAAENLRSIRNSAKKEMIGLPTRFRNLDYVLNGLQGGDLIIVAGRPGMGKTAFGVSLQYNMAYRDNHKIGFFSLEMTKAQLALRLQGIVAGMPYQDLRGGNLTEAQITALEADVQRLMDTQVFIDDSAGLSIVQLRAKALEMVKSHGVELIMVDYLQLMTGTGKRGQNREQEVSDISRGLKMLAKELNIPVIAFSQLSRKVEERGSSKKPILSDLRESGSIEQDSDIVMFLYRPEYYGIMQDETGQSLENVGFVLIEKHRNGNTGEFRLMFEKTIMRYKNYEYDAPQPERFTEQNIIPEDEELPF